MPEYTEITEKDGELHTTIPSGVVKQLGIDANMMQVWQIVGRGDGVVLEVSFE